MAPTYRHDFPDNIDDARARFEDFRDCDPLPNVMPSLLNSADIEDYARQVGLIHQFKRCNLKSASYSGHVGNRVFRWNPNKPVKDWLTQSYIQDLKTEEEFVLEKFSLVLVESEETFLLPHYIAARFNLKIQLVHKGLLLGTGPLVDPGFGGKLLIPLHNLTTNDYKLAQGDDFIWIEFTKTSVHNKWKKKVEGEDLQKTTVLIDFPEDKRFVDTAKYIENALRGRNRKQLDYSRIMSGIPETDRRSIKAMRSVRMLSILLYGFGITGALIGFATMYALYLSIVSLNNELRTALQAMNQELSTSVHGLILENTDRIDVLSNRLDKRLDHSNERIDTTNKRITDQFDKLRLKNTDVAPSLNQEKPSDKKSSEDQSPE